jgi:hypothetical protein
VLHPTKRLLACWSVKHVWDCCPLTSESRHSLRSRSGSSDCCHRFAHSNDRLEMKIATSYITYGLHCVFRHSLQLQSICWNNSQLWYFLCFTEPYFWPCCCTPLESNWSSLFDHCPFFRPPATELCQRFLQSLFVRPGRLSAILHLCILLIVESTVARCDIPILDFSFYDWWCSVSLLEEC